MLDAVKAEAERHYDTSGWTQDDPDEWAERVVRAFAGDDEILGPGAPPRSPSSPRTCRRRCSTR